MAPSRASSAVMPLVLVAGFLSIALQRVSLNVLGGGISASAVLLVLFWAALILAHRWPISRPGLIAYLVLLLLATGTTLANSARDLGLALSLPSLLLVFTTYLPLVLAPRPPGTVAVGWVFARGLLWAVRLGAVLALVQAALQWAGQPFWDPVAESLPAALQTAGFNETYVTSGAEGNLGLSVKPNGVIFLEPSFVSLYCALALVLEAYRVHDFRLRGAAAVRATLWMVVYVAALATSISSSGFVILGLAVLPLLWRYRDRIGLILAALALLGLVSLTGLFDPVIDKLGEGTSGDTSTNLRLALPYETLTPFVQESPVLGYGAGTAGAFVTQIGVEGLQSPTVLKAALEYGIPFTAVLLGIVVAWTLGASRGYVGLGLTLLGLWLVPSEALLSGTTLALLLFMVPNMVARHAPRPGPPGRYLDTGAGPASLARPAPRAATTR